MATLITVSDNPSQDQTPAWAGVYPLFEGSMRQTILEISLSSGISERDLEKQLLLHLPRFPELELNNANVIRWETERLAAKLQLCRRDYVPHKDYSHLTSLGESNLVLRECSPEAARILHERFHYIGSYHPGIAHLGLYVAGIGDLPIALASLAPMDIRRLDPLFPTIEEKKRVLVLSRVFAFAGAPKNTISYLLGRVYAWVRRNLSEVRTLLTFLNPNLGFTGSSFRAANWRPFVEIEPVYAYLEGDYTTYRTLMALPASSTEYVERCRYSLRPLKLLRYNLA